MVYLAINKDFLRPLKTPDEPTEFGSGEPAVERGDDGSAVDRGPEHKDPSEKEIRCQILRSRDRLDLYGAQESLI